MDEKMVGKGLEYPGYDSGFGTPSINKNVGYPYSLGDSKTADDIKKSEIVDLILVVNIDELGQKYLTSSEIASLLGLDHQYRIEYKDHVEIKDGNSLINEAYYPNNEIPISSETIYPDFSDMYPFDELLGMYKLTDSQIDELIGIFERRNPGYKVGIKYEKIIKLSTDKELNSKYADELMNYNFFKENSELKNSESNMGKNR